MVINKRIKRVFLENKAQYIGAVLLIVLSCFLFTNLILVSNNLTRLMNEYEKDYVQEDASFTTDKSIGNLPGLESASDAIIEEGKSFDYALFVCFYGFFEAAKHLNAKYRRQGVAVSEKFTLTFKY